MYQSILTLLSFVDDHLTQVSRTGAFEKVINNELLHLMTTSIDFDNSEQKYTA